MITKKKQKAGEEEESNFEDLYQIFMPFCHSTHLVGFLRVGFAVALLSAQHKFFAVLSFCLPAKSLIAKTHKSQNKYLPHKY